LFELAVRQTLELSTLNNLGISVDEPDLVSDRRGGETVIPVIIMTRMPASQQH
jgi:hypothetical protein